MTNATWPTRVRRLAEISSLTLLALLAASYTLRKPAVALITVLPAWFWAAPGILLVLAARVRGGRRRALLLLAPWTAFLVLFCEEPGALLTLHRTWPDPGWEAARPSGAALRVISFNCGDGRRDAVREALSYSPDILVLQESPAEPDIRAELQAHPELRLLHGFDVSIIARGTLEPAAARQARWMFNAASVTLGTRRIAVVGLRLRVPHFSFAVWSPAEWRDAADAQRDHEGEMRYVLEQVRDRDRSVPLLIAGDFNAPAGDAVFRLLPANLRDTYRVAGIGLGNTMMNDLPVARIDQIWVDDRFKPRAVVVRRTLSSDHRLVIADLTLP